MRLHVHWRVHVRGRDALSTGSQRWERVAPPGLELPEDLIEDLRDLLGEEHRPRVQLRSPCRLHDGQPHIRDALRRVQHERVPVGAAAGLPEPQHQALELLLYAETLREIMTRGVEVHAPLLHGADQQLGKLLGLSLSKLRRVLETHGEEDRARGDLHRVAARFLDCGCRPRRGGALGLWWHRRSEGRAGTAARRRASSVRSCRPITVGS